MLHAFKQSKRGNSIGPWILIFLLLFVLFGTSLWENWGSITDTFLGDLTGSNTVGVGITVNYKDGTSEDYRLKKWFFLPLSVYFGDDPRPILSVDFQLWGTFTFDGTLQSIDQDTNFDFLFGANRILKKSGDVKGPITYLPTSGASFKLTEMTVTADNIQSWAGADGDGTYPCRVDATSTLSIIFSDGSTQTLTTVETVYAFMDFTVEADMGITSLLTITINAQPWHDVSDTK